MFVSRRFVPLLFAACTTLCLFLLFQTTELSASLRHVPLVVGLDDEDDSAETSLPDEDGDSQPLTSMDEEYHELYVNPNPLFVPGVPKPPGSEYSRTLVIPKLASENTSWIEEELGDILHPNGPLKSAVYVVDDSHAPLHPPKNKGNEVMVYLSYIIDHYDDLPDVAMFMHAHRLTWHNNDIQDYDAANMVRSLSSERVTRQGYMNLRCQWDPGCPAWLHPGSIEDSWERPEEVLIAESWTQLFPFDPIPSVLSQPCCSQFALSKGRMLAIPLSRYIYYRDWLLRTPLSDYISGRVFEYVFQFLFTGEHVMCPAVHECFCDGYGLCFGGEEKLNHYYDLRYALREHGEELAEWREKERELTLARKEGRFNEASTLEIPELGRDDWLIAEMAALRRALADKVTEAKERGKSARLRAEEIGRAFVDGDGF